MNHKIIICFSLSITLQVSVLIGEFISHMYPHWTGEEVLLNIRPVDPRSLFRGQYVRLDYNLNSISNKIVSKFEKDKPVLKHGQIIYISLVTKDGISFPDDVFLIKPYGLRSIQGRIDRKYLRSRYNNKPYPPKIKLGIEAYFASPENAKRIENSIRNTRNNNTPIARVMLASNGKAALKELLINR